LAASGSGQALTRHQRIAVMMSLCAAASRTATTLVVITSLTALVMTAALPAG
jgi:hypothetical protein